MPQTNHYERFALLDCRFCIFAQLDTSDRAIITARLIGTAPFKCTSEEFAYPLSAVPYEKLFDPTHTYDLHDCECREFQLKT